MREKQVAAIAQPIYDELVRIPHDLALQPVGCSAIERAIGLHRAVNGQLLAQPRLIIFNAMPRRGVHKAGAIFKRDIVRSDYGEDRGVLSSEFWVLSDSTSRGRLRVVVFQLRTLNIELRTFSVHKRMHIPHAREIKPFGDAQHFDIFHAADFRDLLRHLFCHDDELAIQAHQGVAIIRRDSHREIRRQRPRRGRPDHHVNFVAAFVQRRVFADDFIEQTIATFRSNLKHHINARVLAVFVFKFRFSEGRLIRNRPVHRLERPVDQAFSHEVGKNFERGCLELGIHREVRIVVVGEGEQPFHLSALELDVFLGIVSAAFANLNGHHSASFVAQFLHDFVFDGEAVTIPAGDVGHIKTRHGACANDEVFEDFVEQMAQMNRAVGIRRAIVKHEAWLARTGSANLLIELALLPALERCGFVLHQIGLHVEGRLGQVEGVLEGFLFFSGVGHGNQRSEVRSQKSVGQGVSRQCERRSLAESSQVNQFKVQGSKLKVQRSR